MTRILGIVNGTTNYMLAKMDEQSASYEDVLADAQRLGYAEADPTADVGGVCTYERLVEATLPYGLAPYVVPQLKTITLGGAVTGLLLGVGIAAASSLSHRLFGGQGLRVWIIEVGGDVVSLTVAGLILGAFG